MSISLSQYNPLLQYFWPVSGEWIRARVLAVACPGFDLLLSISGSMKPDHCIWMIREYNGIYELDMSDSLIRECVNRNTTATGTEIDGLLRSLLSQQ